MLDDVRVTQRKARDDYYRARDWSSKRVDGEGPPWARMAFVGEAPGVDEDAAGRPFIGASGRLLTRLLQRCNLRRDHVYITNVFKYRPLRNNVALFYEDAHLRRLRPEFAGVYEEVRAELKQLSELRVVVLLGRIPLMAFFDLREIGKYRGSPLKHPEFPGVWFIPAFHPALCLRQWKWTHILAADIDKAAQIMRGQLEVETERHALLPSDPNFQERCLDYLRSIKPGTTVVCDVEVMQGLASCIVLATSPTSCCVVPFADPNKPDWCYWTFDDEVAVWEEVIRILEDPGITKVFHNAMFDVPFLLRVHNIRVQGEIRDTMIMHHDVYPELPKGLDFLVSFYMTEPYYKDDLKIWRTEQTDFDLLWEYAAKDGWYTYECYERLRAEVDQAKVSRIIEFDHSLIQPLTFMSVKGFAIDHSKIDYFRAKLEEVEARAQDALNQIVGWPVNVNSTKDMQKLLYEPPPAGFGFTLRYHEKSGSVTTNEETIEEFMRAVDGDRRLALQCVLDIRRARKLRSTYLEMKEVGGCVLTSYKIGGTFTGRLASSRDIFGHGLQMQNIPKNLREIFVADEGKMLVQADLSQAEARVVAALALDQKLLDVFASGGDIHRVNASNIFRKPVDEITSEERQMAKRVVHASNYDMSWRKFMKIAGLTAAEAKTLLATYHATYPGIRKWHRAVQEELSRTRTLWNPFGRRYVFLDRWGPELFRKAYAAVPQGTVADLLNRALVAFYHQSLTDQNLDTVEILTQVHDSIVFQVSPEQLRYACRVLKALMEQEFVVQSPLGGNVKIRIPADFEVGRNWGPRSDTNPDGLEEYCVS